MKTFIKGNYRKSIYKSDKGYVIGLFKVRDTNDENIKKYVNKTITFTGYFHDLNEDDIYCFYGELVETPKYGTQFQVSEYERLKPDDEDGVVAFLSSDLFKGVGEVLAKSIVETLGKDALNLIVQDENSLMDVPKMTMKKAHKIYDTLMKYEESHQMIVYLTELGFNMKDSLSIYNEYKKDTITKIEHNIFRIIEDIKGLSFTKIDEISKKMDFKENDDRRIKACIIYVMNKLIYSNSDTFLYIDEIYDNTYRYLNFDIDNFDELLNELVIETKIVIKGDKYYLKDIFDSENTIVNSISYLINKDVTKYKKLDESINNQEKINDITYNDQQKEAITKSLQNNITIITGGPGTGKTTIIKAICDIYMEINKLDYEEAIEKIALLAPTGRASKRMSESTLLPASTIHRFLKWNKETNEFSVNEYEPNFHQLIIIDEVSMIDINLLSSLFKGLTKNIKLILVGDHNQLPSVGPGQILKDLINSEVIDTIYLDKLYRSSEDSYIATLATEINNNELSDNLLKTKSDYTFLQCNSNSLKENLKNLCYQLIEKQYDYKRVQIMAPMYAGINGIDNLNVELQEVFNPKNGIKNEVKYGDVIYRENDKILQLVNNPDENVYNGDIGIIKNIIKEDKKTEVYIDFDGNLVRYTLKDLSKIKHGYVITIHKSQGSEFELVVMPVCDSYRRMLYRKLIYTGVTRAKRKLILIGNPDSFIYSINNNDENIRKTNLKEELMNNIIKKM